ncbi:MAG: hypothetical protein ACFFEY_02535, partial [Candidatus Thorarchaeota archaeon]
IYYQKAYSYLKDLITYKKINLNKKIKSESESDFNHTLGLMLKAINTGLNTIGIHKDVLNNIQNNFVNSLNKNDSSIVNYNSCFDSYLKDHVNKLLIEILFDYLTDSDYKKLENVNLFDLLPPYFISKLNELKKSHFKTPQIVDLFKQKDFFKFINSIDLTVKEIEKPTEIDILNQLKTAKEGSIKTLETFKKETSSKMSSVQEIRTSSEGVSTSYKTEEMEKSIDSRFETLLNTGSFIDYFGNFNPIHSDIIMRFKINKKNIVNSELINREFFDLENLFYYISILKMLNLEFPFKNSDVNEILPNYIRENIFTSSKQDIPDIISIFYGLSIFSELDLFNKTNLIDIRKIYNFILSELANIVPKKVMLNTYVLLCLKLILTVEKQIDLKDLSLEPIVNFDLLSIDNSKTITHMYYLLVALKLLGKEKTINRIQENYGIEIKKLFNQNNPLFELITESGKTLLILSLLELKEKEQELCANLLNQILNKTSFFYLENVNRNFNWQTDKLAFKIELEILYWALLACSQYVP